MYLFIFKLMFSYLFQVSIMIYSTRNPEQAWPWGPNFPNYDEIENTLSDLLIFNRAYFIFIFIEKQYVQCTYLQF